jgi:hypothetical protein
MNRIASQRITAQREQRNAYKNALEPGSGAVLF